MARRTAVAIAAIALLGLGGCDRADAPDVATAGTAVPKTSPGGASSLGDDKRFMDCLREQGATVDKRRGTGKVTQEQMAKCRRYAPAEELRPKFTAEDVEQLRVYARCLREHGVPDFPDPRPDGTFPEGGPRAKGNRAMQAAMEECRDRMPRMRVGGPSGKAVPGG